MNYCKYIKYAVSLCLLISIIFSSMFIKSDEAFLLPYEDVTQDKWYFDSVYSLYNAGILDDGISKFSGEDSAPRKEIVLYLYRLNMSLCETMPDTLDIPFADVPEQGEIRDAVSWAYHSGIVKGKTEDSFDPNGQTTREQLCTIVMRYILHSGLKPQKNGNDGPFEDSLSVSDFARSHVVAAKLSGIINGDGAGFLRPQDSITRAELCKVISQVLSIASTPTEDGTEFVDLTDGIYNSKYAEYKKFFIDRDHTAYVGTTDPVDLSYFDDAAFIGDSVTLSLQYYCAATKALGNATFLCAGSLSPLNAHWEISDESKHPVYNGVKMKVEDAVKACGARKVYIMLGINSLAFGLDKCVEDMTLLINKIVSASPDVQIILQSVTPMTEDSPIITAKLNNNVINQYNSRMYDLAQENGWYYVNVSEVLHDGKGNLNKNLCSDPKSMGIHFTFEADKVWIDYIRTHAPNI